MVSQKTTHTGSDVARVNKDEEPVPINDRIMTMRLPLQRNMYATFLSVYAPTMTNTGEVKEDKGKILARVLLNRLNQHTSDFLLEIGSRKVYRTEHATFCSLH